MPSPIRTSSRYVEPVYSPGDVQSPMQQAATAPEPEPVYVDRIQEQIDSYRGRGYQIISRRNISANEAQIVVLPPGAYSGQEKVIILHTSPEVNPPFVSGGYQSPGEARDIIFSKAIEMPQAERNAYLKEIGAIEPSRTSYGTSIDELRFKREVMISEGRQTPFQYPKTAGEVVMRSRELPGGTSAFNLWLVAGNTLNQGVKTFPSIKQNNIIDYSTFSGYADSVDKYNKEVKTFSKSIESYELAPSLKKLRALNKQQEKLSAEGKFLSGFNPLLNRQETITAQQGFAMDKKYERGMGTYNKILGGIKEGAQISLWGLSKPIEFAAKAPTAFYPAFNAKTTLKESYDFSKMLVVTPFKIVEPASASVYQTIGAKLYTLEQRKEKRRQISQLKSDFASVGFIKAANWIPSEPSAFYGKLTGVGVKTVATVDVFGAVHARYPLAVETLGGINAFFEGKKLLSPDYTFEEKIYAGANAALSGFPLAYRGYGFARKQYELNFGGAVMAKDFPVEFVEGTTVPADLKTLRKLEGKQIISIHITDKPGLNLRNGNVITLTAPPAYTLGGTRGKYNLGGFYGSAPELIYKGGENKLVMGVIKKQSKLGKAFADKQNLMSLLPVPQRVIAGIRPRAYLGYAGILPSNYDKPVKVEWNLLPPQIRAITFVPKVTRTPRGLGKNIPKISIWQNVQSNKAFLGPENIGGVSTESQIIVPTKYGEGMGYPKGYENFPGSTIKSLDMGRIVYYRQTPKVPKSIKGNELLSDIYTSVLSRDYRIEFQAGALGSMTELGSKAYSQKQIESDFYSGFFGPQSKELVTTQKAGALIIPKPVQIAAPVPIESRSVAGGSMFLLASISKSKTKEKDKISFPSKPSSYVASFPSVPSYPSSSYSRSISSISSPSRASSISLVSAPSYPSAPSVPSFPSMPSVPSKPSRPSVPSYPSRPSYPSMPSYPSRPNVPDYPPVINIKDYWKEGKTKMKRLFKMPKQLFSYAPTLQAVTLNISSPYKNASKLFNAKFTGLEQRPAAFFGKKKKKIKWVY